MGRYRGEKQYKEFGIPCEREKIVAISFGGERSGRSKVDFIIDDKIVLEIMSKRFLEKQDYYQMMRYLDSCRKRLGILVNFHQKYLVPKRILHGYS